MKKTKIMTALLIMSTVLMMKMAVSPILFEIGKSFPEAGLSQLQMVYTITSIVALPIMLLSGNLTGIISKKNLVLMGLVFLFIGGIMPFYFNESLVQLYVASAIMGTGIAIINVLSSALISDYFQGIDKGRVMGYQSASLSIAGAIFSSGSGKIATTFSWPYSYLLFLLVIPVFFIVLFMLPADKPQKREKGSGSIYTRKLITWAILGALFSIFMYAYDTNISMFIETEGFGGADTAGTVSAMFLIIGIPAGLLLGNLMKILKRNVVGIAAMTLGLGMLVLAVAQNLPMVYLGAFLYGVGFAVRNPASITFAAYMVEPAAAAAAIALLNAFSTAAGFFSPYIVNEISARFGGSFRTTFLVCGLVIILIGFGYLFLNPVQNRDMEEE